MNGKGYWEQHAAANYKSDAILDRKLKGTHMEGKGHHVNGTFRSNRWIARQAKKAEFYRRVEAKTDRR